MTAVSKASPGIKRIVSAIETSSGQKWSGRKIFVEQVDPGWTYLLYNDTGEPYVYQVGHLGGRFRPAVFRIPKPSYGGPATIIGAPSGGEVVVTRDIGPTGTITIYVPRLDEAQLDVARDALLSKHAISPRALTDELGPYGGIARAIVESQGKTLEKVESGKTSRQLDREIAEFMRGRR